MQQTVLACIESIVTQIDDSWEVVVVDDASTDGTTDVVRAAERDYGAVRGVYLDEDPSRQLGRTRNIAVRAADGDYVLSHLDADETYHGGALSGVVGMYHTIELTRDRPFVLQTNPILVGRRDHLLDLGPYRNLAVGGEDLDLWRRLAARDELVCVATDVLADKIGYYKDRRKLVTRWARVAIADFQTGIRPWSYVRYAIEQPNWKRALVLLGLLPIAYLQSRGREQFEPVNGYRSKGRIEREMML